MRIVPSLYPATTDRVVVRTFLIGLVVAVASIDGRIELSHEVKQVTFYKYSREIEMIEKIK